MNKLHLKIELIANILFIIAILFARKWRISSFRNQRGSAFGGKPKNFGTG